MSARQFQPPIGARSGIGRSPRLLNSFARGATKLPGRATAD